MILDANSFREFEFRNLDVDYNFDLPPQSVFVSKLLIPQGRPVSVIHGPLQQLCARFLDSLGYTAVIEAPTQAGLEEGDWACQTPVLPRPDSANSLFAASYVKWWRLGDGGSGIPEGESWSRGGWGTAE